MKEHEKRVLEEYKELNEKTKKLAAFTRSDLFTEVSQYQSGLLYAQVHVMMAYRSVLISRLADFGVALDYEEV